MQKKDVKILTYFCKNDRCPNFFNLWILTFYDFKNVVFKCFKSLKICMYKLYIIYLYLIIWIWI